MLYQCFDVEITHLLNVIDVKGVELELRKLEGSVEAIHENLIRLKDR